MLSIILILVRLSNGVRQVAVRNVIMRVLQTGTRHLGHGLLGSQAVPVTVLDGMLVEGRPPDTDAVLRLLGLLQLPNVVGRPLIGRVLRTHHPVRLLHDGK